MYYEIKKQSDGKYMAVGTSWFIIHIYKDLTLDDAARKCWLDKNPEKRYQIWANGFNGRQVLTWYSEDKNVIIPNAYASIEEARIRIVKKLKDVCCKNGYETHPNPHGDYSIIDTFTGDEVDYQISEKEAAYPTDADFDKYDLIA